MSLFLLSCEARENGMKYPLNRDWRSSTSGEIVALSGRVGNVGTRVLDRIV